MRHYIKSQITRETGSGSEPDQDFDEEEYLRQVRLEAERAKDEMAGEERAGFKSAMNKLKRLRARTVHIGFVEGGLVAFVAIAADIIDYLVIGSIPVIGDILDIAVWFVIAIWVWSRRIQKPPASLFSGVIELIPLGDLVPTWTFMVLAIVIYNNHRRNLSEKQIKNKLAGSASAGKHE